MTLSRSALLLALAVAPFAAAKPATPARGAVLGQAAPGAAGSNG